MLSRAFKFLLGWVGWEQLEKKYGKQTQGKTMSGNFEVNSGAQRDDVLKDYEEGKCLFK